jgi:hypothetical protein
VRFKYQSKTILHQDLTACSIYRSQTIQQNYNLGKSDQFVSIQGQQNISFAFPSPTNPSLRQRIDRHFQPSDYWIWGTGRLDPINYSLVVQSGNDGFACYTRGNNLIYLPRDLTVGYVDGTSCIFSVHIR